MSIQPSRNLNESQRGSRMMLHWYHNGKLATLRLYESCHCWRSQTILVTDFGRDSGQLLDWTICRWKWLLCCSNRCYAYLIILFCLHAMHVQRVCKYFHKMRYQGQMYPQRSTHWVCYLWPWWCLIVGRTERDMIMLTEWLQVWCWYRYCDDGWGNTKW